MFLIVNNKIVNKDKLRFLRVDYDIEYDLNYDPEEVMNKIYFTFELNFYDNSSYKVNNKILFLNKKEIVDFFFYDDIENEQIYKFLDTFKEFMIKIIFDKLNNNETIIFKDIIEEQKYTIDKLFNMYMEMQKQKEGLNNEKA